jgi:crotonobetainyl-CoA:carnitine CoA-transferase CaiB-like acyl-CoA transferase
MASALDGIRILDLTLWQQGPYASAMLADLGADVIKIEAPASPDPGRAFLFHRELGLSVYFHAHNRGKRSLAIDLKHPQGKEAFFRLVERSDVFLNNLRLGALKRLGLSYEALRAVNPRIVYVHASAWGSQGPDADLGSFDMLAQARSGIVSNNGEPEGPPLPVPVAIADQVGAMLTAYGIMTALFHRERSGEGQEVEVSLLAGQLALQCFNVSSYLLTRRLPRRRPRGRFTPLWNTYRGSDGKYLALAMVEDRWWPGTCRALGQPELEHDPRFDTAKNRYTNSQQLVDHMDAIFDQRPAREWVERFQAEGLMAGPVQDYEELVCDPQVTANAYVEDVDWPGHQPLRIPGSGVRFSRTPARIRGMAPALGAHTREVLLECDFSQKEIDRLEAEGVVHQDGGGAK